MSKTIELSIKHKAKKNYKAIIYIDGLDKKNSQRINRLLHQHKIQSAKPRNARDESEPLIRLADRWAGCIRSAIENNKNDKQIVELAKKQMYLHKV